MLTWTKKVVYYQAMSMTTENILTNAKRLSTAE